MHTPGLAAAPPSPGWDLPVMEEEPHPRQGLLLSCSPARQAAINTDLPPPQPHTCKRGWSKHTPCPLPSPACKRQSPEGEHTGPAGHCAPSRGLPSVEDGKPHWGFLFLCNPTPRLGSAQHCTLSSPHLGGGQDENTATQLCTRPLQARVCPAWEGKPPLGASPSPTPWLTAWGRPWLGSQCLAGPVYSTPTPHLLPLTGRGWRGSGTELIPAQ